MTTTRRKSLTGRVLPPLIRFSLVASVVALGSQAGAYPTDEFERTGIRRLKWQYNVDFGEARGRKVDPGGRWAGKDITLKMTGAGKDYQLSTETPKDPQLQAALEQILKKWRWRRYNIAILDITDPSKPRFAGVNEDQPQTPGSVAKVLCASALLEQLKQRYPNDTKKREEILKSHMVSADDWSRTDSHEVPITYGDDGLKVTYRKIRDGDTFSLWEWVDHALSPSNNSAAATIWREAVLMKLMGEEYPPEKYNRELFAQWDKETMTEASFGVVDKPLVDAGIDPETFKLQLYFTRGANRYIKSGPSRATPLAIVQWMLKVEQGKMVDHFSSMELKKMLYLTRRRVRYLYTDKLNDYAAYFKSGSLYRFSESVKTRIAYQGDVINVLNTVVEIDTTPPPPEPKQEDEKAKAEKKEDAKAKAEEPKEPELDPKVFTPDGKPYVYIVAVMSNELKRNAAMDHSRLGEAIHDIITAPRESPESAEGEDSKKQ